MSRLGKLPIELPQGVEAKIDGEFIVVKGPKGELKEKLNKSISLTLESDKITVAVSNPKIKKEKALWGLFRNLIRNMVVGVTVGFEKKLEINGVGYKVQGGGKKLIFNVGYSHPVEFDLPAGLDSKVEGNVITISGYDKKLVGEISYQIRKIRQPEPYKGKGIKYADEVLRRKEGKIASKGE
jgi:large subunit ribosomal protein L6